MAVGTKIIFEFEGASGSTVRHSYSYGDNEATTSDIKAYMNAAITNSSMFKNPPAAIKGARAEVTTENIFDLEN